MKKKILYFSLIFIIIFSNFTVSFGANFYDDETDDDIYNYYNYKKEVIEDYDVEIYVNEDSSMDVTETITVYAKNNKITHGIYRDFPIQYKNKKVTFDVEEVYCDGEEVNYKLENITRGVRIKIGNEDEVVSVGEHTYTISYKTERQIIYEDDYDELYWNVIGSGWDFDIEHCHAIVYFPKGTDFIKNDLETYTGKYGSKEDNYDVSYEFLEEKNAVEFEIYESMKANEAFTIDVFIEKGTLIEPSFRQKFCWFLEDNIIKIILFLGLVLLMVWQYFQWNKIGKDPKPNVIIPRYYPPENLEPADLKYIQTMGKTDRILEATIINLAVKGYLNIGNDDTKKKKMIIRKITEQKVIEKLEPLTENEEQVYNKLNSVETLEYSSTLQLKLSKLKDNIKDNLNKKYNNKLFFKNSMKTTISIITLVIVFIISLIVGFSVNSYNAMNFIENIMIIMPIAFVFISVLACFITLCTSVKKSTWLKILVLIMFVIPGSIMIISMLFGIASLLLENISAAVVLGSYILDIYLFDKLIRRYTEDGLRIKENIEGFKMFINTAKDDDFAEKTPEMFDKYFAYAYVLGMENKWAEKFEDVFATSNYSPTWCSNVYIISGEHFDSKTFTKAFSNSFSSGMSSASTAPSSHGGSGGSGGGFSGGGGGGRRPEVAGKILFI